MTASDPPGAKATVLPSAVAVEEVACPLCGRPRDEIAIRENGWLGRRCTDCAVIFVSPRPTAAAVRRLYESDSARVDAACLEAAPVASRLHARHVLRLLRRQAASGSLLEVGCGMGGFLVEAANAGYDVAGIDLNPKQVAGVTARGIPCECAALADEPFAGRMFDVIYSCDVLSHFSDPREDVARMASRLAPGGILVMETGNLADTAARYFDYFAEFQYPDHLYFFGESSLRRLLEEPGLRVVEFRRYALVPYLVLARAMTRAIRAVKRDKAAPRIAEVSRLPVATPGAARLSRRVRARRAIRDRVLHEMLFTLGRLWPKRARPLSLIVMARK